MRVYRKHSMVVILILSAIITPPDITSQVLVSLPLIILYEFSIKISERVIKNQENKYERPNFQISCVDQIHSNALVQFHRNFLQLAGDSTVHSKSHERQLLGHCVSLDQGRFSEAKEILKDAFEKIQNLQNHQNKSEQVYSIELALFPLTKGEESE